MCVMPSGTRLGTLCRPGQPSRQPRDAGTLSPCGDAESGGGRCVQDPMLFARPALAWFLPLWGLLQRRRGPCHLLVSHLIADVNKTAEQVLGYLGVETITQNEQHAACFVERWQGPVQPHMLAGSVTGGAGMGWKLPGGRDLRGSRGAWAMTLSGPPALSSRGWTRQALRT